MKKILLFIVVTYSMQAFCQGRQDSTLNRYFAALTQQQKFNGNVLVARDNEVLLMSSYNMPNQPTRMRVSLESKFIIASVSKLFIKYGVLKLAEQGRLTLHDTVDKFLPQFPNGSNITVWQLMTHTSGLPRELTDFEKYDSVTLEQTVTLAAQEKLDFKPGSDTLYSNVAYFLLDAIIAKASTEGYPLYIERNILMPLHMSDTHEFTSNKPAGSLVYGFRKQDGSIEPVDKKNIDRFETGNYYSTIDDLFRFSREMFSGTVLSPSRSMHMLNRDSIVVQAGGRPGYRAYFYKNLRTNLTFIFLSNYSDVPFNDIVRDIPDIIAGKPVAMPKAIQRNEIHLNETVLRRYTGTFVLEADSRQTFTVALERGSLVLIDKSGDKTTMKADSDTTFFDDPHSEDGIQFVTANNVYDLVILSNGIKFRTKRIKQ